MVFNKSQDPYIQIIAALLRDVQTLHSEVFSPRSERLTVQKIVSRLEREGMSFLTKTLPRLGKSLDRALLGEVPLDSTGFRKIPGSELPRFLGELFQCIFSHDGWVLPTPCVKCIKTVRQILFVFYKLELPYSSTDEAKVLQSFIETEKVIAPFNHGFNQLAERLDADPSAYETIPSLAGRRIVRKARKLLQRLFSNFDHLDIHPRHGPGVVSTKERLWEKYRWDRINPRIVQTYPFDTYFKASLGHICDSYKEDQNLVYQEASAQVILVPKDSRGPRLISCEPLEFQWIQQGLGRAIVNHVEHHPLTRFNVHFTDQRPNQLGALLGSERGLYATLDLKEASDRVTCGLVNLLFPDPIKGALMNCRSLSTLLPNGEKIDLDKYAPMGSALCFPVLALTIWAILTAGCEDADTRDSVLVYGDDVIVKTAQAANAIAQLEAFGLLVNRAKSCVTGFFRESCGVDAYQGVDVTPVRLRTLWRRNPSADVYTSYIAFANHLYNRRFFTTYDLIVGWLLSVYGEIPCADMSLTCPSLVEVPEVYRPKRRRNNSNLQKLEYYVYDVRTRPVKREIDGWSMLLRYFAEVDPSSPSPWSNDKPRRCGVGAHESEPFSVRLYTRPRASLLVRRWR